MTDKIILAPYYWFLRLRHTLYDKGVMRSSRGAIPTIAIGNVTVGGTGKTPHTELVLRTLMSDEIFRRKKIAVLSRGYKGSATRYTEVSLSSSSALVGDEPLQIKRKFPCVTVAVDKNRIEGCRHLSEGFEPCDLAVLDDALQYRALRPDLSIMLVDYNRPVFEDHLLPLGRLRDIPERVATADIVIVTKCPPFMEESERDLWRERLHIDGRGQKLFFTKIEYCRMEPVFPECNLRYHYSSQLVLFSGIANDSPLMDYLSDNYTIVRHFTFPDHHRFTRRDVSLIEKAAQFYPTSLVVTTEKDSQRIWEVKRLSRELKLRMFKIPIRASFLREEDEAEFSAAILGRLRGLDSSQD